MKTATCKTKTKTTTTTTTTAATTTTTNGLVYDYACILNEYLQPVDSMTGNDRSTEYDYKSQSDAT